MPVLMILRSFKRSHCQVVCPYDKRSQFLFNNSVLSLFLSLKKIQFQKTFMYFLSNTMQFLHEVSRENTAKDFVRMMGDMK
mgnify:CR=1 FL=1